MTERTTTAITGIVTIAVPVTDQVRALAFYTGTLGLEIRRDMPFGPGMRWVEVAAPESVVTIALPPKRDDIPAGIETGIRLGTPDAAGLHAKLAAEGADVDSEIMQFGAGVPPMFYVRDPDGNRIVIVEDSGR